MCWNGIFIVHPMGMLLLKPYPLHSKVYLKCVKFTWEILIIIEALYLKLNSHFEVIYVGSNLTDLNDITWQTYKYNL